MSIKQSNKLYIHPSFTVMHYRFRTTSDVPALDGLDVFVNELFTLLLETDQIALSRWDADNYSYQPNPGARWRKSNKDIEAVTKDENEADVMSGAFRSELVVHSSSSFSVTSTTTAFMIILVTWFYTSVHDVNRSHLFKITFTFFQ